MHLLGVLMLLAPFVALFLFIWSIDSLLVALGLFGAVFLTIAWISIAFYLTTGSL